MYARALVMVDSDFPLSPTPPQPNDEPCCYSIYPGTTPLLNNIAMDAATTPMQQQPPPQQKKTTPLQCATTTHDPPRKRVFSKEEVATHNSVESCWLIVGTDVYDVTPFLALHPAGAKPLLRRAGGDATRDFSFHSRTAQKSWRQYKIGVLEGSDSYCLLM